MQNSQALLDIVEMTEVSFVKNSAQEIFTLYSLMKNDPKTLFLFYKIVFRIVFRH